VPFIEEKNKISLLPTAKQTGGSQESSQGSDCLSKLFFLKIFQQTTFGKKMFM
jgi:hypothetical protein